jgi:predicted fused transcriptional regulator/phosphomethylpyrimidine kinase
VVVSDLFEIICKDKPIDRNRRITVRTVSEYNGIYRVLWIGKATELKDAKGIANKTVVELLVDYNDMTTDIIYNKGKVITVI